MNGLNSSIMTFYEITDGDLSEFTGEFDNNSTQERTTDDKVHG